MRDTPAPPLSRDAREAAHDLIRLFDHRELVVANGNERRAETGDVRGLAHRIGEKANRDIAHESAQLDLAAYGWIALESRERHEIQIQHGELGELGNRGLKRDRRLGGVDAHREIVQSDLEHISSHISRPTRVVGECLQVGDENRLLMDVLQRDAVPQRARVVAEVQRTGRSIAGEHDLAHHSGGLHSGH